MKKSRRERRVGEVLHRAGLAPARIDQLVDFMVEDILATLGDRLLDEVGEDCGDPNALATEFDTIVLPVLYVAAVARHSQTTTSGTHSANEKTANEKTKVEGESDRKATESVRTER